ncbi:bifunctional ADP-dependent NAD(P)H-hydrate dehydratase/NAD(P)H-hydrate epimerase [Deinococcus sp. YIM 77859]|uniref:bifunctional ADP-dependent NAD(P)H-hydrate dehydratase/NAD(P)H-hydrate epimerase n=1 Tax=Deinococcus sp. YIM 77859 TaxID=1540221 RepID=UPI0005527430|nr:bifunctional ADP-dependent NAD(P)H-hydrate dehydratase/NAD(P)H-hydrate epimerase [Deinococcus sp. YIM 77859]
MPEFVFSPEGVGAVDARLDGAQLLDQAMEEAGRAVADVLHARFPQSRVQLLAGGGANGGDALVAARHLMALGHGVEVLAAPPTHPLTRLNWQRLAAFGLQPEPLTRQAVTRRAAEVSVLVDGLLGTGFQPPLRAEQAEIVEAVNAVREQGVQVVAIDLPSGLDAASAAVPGPAVHADLTVTLMGFKPALLFGPAARQAGEVRLAPLRVPSAWLAAEALAVRPTDAEIAALLPIRPADAHKGTAGHVWVIGGAPGTVGAAALAGLGALRAGAGLVTVYSSVQVPLVTPELMVRQHDALDRALEAALARSRPDALCVGMGLGPDAAALTRQVLAWEVPAVLDADALQPELAGKGHAACVWTPHPGEAARLLGVATGEVTRDPLAAARTLQERFGGVVVLKGGPSVIAHAQGLSVSRGGHPGMASAGLGDTLSGVIAALLGQGLGALEAALVGVRLHARAGERAGARQGYGLIASDVSAELGGAWLDLWAAAGKAMLS